MQILLSIIYISFAFIGVLHLFISNKIYIIFKRFNKYSFKHSVNFPTQIETKQHNVSKQQNVSIDIQSNKKQNIQDTIFESLVKHANRLLVET